MGFWDWSETSSENTSVDGVNINEGMPGRNVNNSIRGLMRVMRLFGMDISGAQAAKSTGTAAALTLTTKSGIALSDGIRLTFIPGVSANAGATLNVDTTLAKQIQTRNGTNIVLGEIIADKPADVI